MSSRRRATAPSAPLALLELALERAHGPRRSAPARRTTVSVGGRRLLHVPRTGDRQ